MLSLYIFSGKMYEQFTSQENADYLSNKLRARVSTTLLKKFLDLNGLKCKTTQENVWQQVREMNRRFIDVYRTGMPSYNDYISESQVLKDIGGGVVSAFDPDESWDSGDPNRSAEQTAAEFMERDGTFMFKRDTKGRQVWQDHKKLVQFMDYEENYISMETPNRPAPKGELTLEERRAYRKARISMLG
jgi:hypothetical protein